MFRSYYKVNTYDYPFVAIMLFSIGCGSTSHSSIFQQYSDGIVVQFPALGSVPVVVLNLRPEFRVAHTKHDVISILMNKYTYIITEHESLHKKKRFDWTLRGHDP